MNPKKRIVDRIRCVQILLKFVPVTSKWVVGFVKYVLLVIEEKFKPPPQLLFRLCDPFYIEHLDMRLLYIESLSIVQDPNNVSLLGSFLLREGFPFYGIQALSNVYSCTGYPHVGHKNRSFYDDLVRTAIHPSTKPANCYDFFLFLISKALPCYPLYHHSISCSVLSTPKLTYLQKKNLLTMLKHRNYPDIRKCDYGEEGYVPSFLCFLRNIFNNLENINSVVLESVDLYGSYFAGQRTLDQHSYILAEIFTHYKEDLLTEHILDAPKFRIDHGYKLFYTFVLRNTNIWPCDRVEIRTSYDPLLTSHVNFFTFSLHLEHIKLAYLIGLISRDETWAGLDSPNRMIVYENGYRTVCDFVFDVCSNNQNRKIGETRTCSNLKFLRDLQLAFGYPAFPLCPCDTNETTIPSLQRIVARKIRTQIDNLSFDYCKNMLKSRIHVCLLLLRLKLISEPLVETILPHVSLKHLKRTLIIENGIIVGVKGTYEDKLNNCQECPGRCTRPIPLSGYRMLDIPDITDSDDE